nr:ribonuclease H-like domain-containing protein [Tanacetum cinerariifolium]
MTVNAAGPLVNGSDRPSMVAVNGCDRRSMVAVNDGHRWRTIVDHRRTTVDHHRTNGQPPVNGLESVEARLEVYKKNAPVFKDDIKILKLDVMFRDMNIKELRQKHEKAEKERDDLKLTLEKFEDSSKNLNRLLDSQQCDKSKTGLGYDSQGFDRKFMAPKPDLVFADEHVVSESITSLCGITKIKVKTSESKPKTVSAPIIEDWVSDSEDENEIETETKQIKPSFAKGNPQQELQKKGVIDSGCSRHMTGNMSYLSEYEEIDGGYVAFGGYPKGGKITDTECVVLSPNFKLLDESQVLLRVPRQNNMYSVDLRNFTLSGGLTCLFAKAILDESNLWHRRNRKPKDHKVKIIRCDNGTEFKNKEINQFCKMKGIRREFSVARTPQQNGIAERKNKTLLEAVRTMPTDFKLPTTVSLKILSRTRKFIH